MKFYRLQNNKKIRNKKKNKQIKKKKKRLSNLDTTTNVKKQQYIKNIESTQKYKELKKSNNKGYTKKVKSLKNMNTNDLAKLYTIILSEESFKKSNNKVTKNLYINLIKNFNTGLNMSTLEQKDVTNLKSTYDDLLKKILQNEKDLNVLRKLKQGEIKAAVNSKIQSTINQLTEQNKNYSNSLKALDEFNKFNENIKHIKNYFKQMDILMASKFDRNIIQYILKKLNITLNLNTDDAIKNTFTFFIKELIQIIFTITPSNNKETITKLPTSKTNFKHFSTIQLKALVESAQINSQINSTSNLYNNKVTSKYTQEILPKLLDYLEKIIQLELSLDNQINISKKNDQLCNEEYQNQVDKSLKHDTFRELVESYFETVSKLYWFTLNKKYCGQ